MPENEECAVSNQNCLYCSGSLTDAMKTGERIAVLRGREAIVQLWYHERCEAGMKREVPNWFSYGEEKKS